ncbi:MAG: hypothetical protein V1881_01310 [Candidatus Micrarchaeota archaeon]
MRKQKRIQQEADRFDNSYKSTVRRALGLPDIKTLKKSHQIKLNLVLFTNAHKPAEYLEAELAKLAFLSDTQIKSLLKWHAGASPKLFRLRESRPT